MIATLAAMVDKRGGHAMSTVCASVQGRSQGHLRQRRRPCSPCQVSRRRNHTRQSRHLRHPVGKHVPQWVMFALLPLGKASRAGSRKKYSTRCSHTYVIQRALVARCSPIHALSRQRCCTQTSRALQTWKPTSGRSPRGSGKCPKKPRGVDAKCRRSNFQMAHASAHLLGVMVKSMVVVLVGACASWRSRRLMHIAFPIFSTLAPQANSTADGGRSNSRTILIMDSSASSSVVIRVSYSTIPNGLAPILFLLGLRQFGSGSQGVHVSDRLVKFASLVAMR
jgi:hypothetical protein